MVAATIVAKWDHPKKIADSFRDLTKAQAALVANDQLMERRMPGWIEAGMRINEDVNASVEKSLREAREAAERLLEAPVQTDLLRHWSALGGPGE